MLMKMAATWESLAGDRATHITRQERRSALEGKPLDSMHQMMSDLPSQAAPAGEQGRSALVVARRECPLSRPWSWSLTGREGPGWSAFVKRPANQRRVNGERRREGGACGRP